MKDFELIYKLVDCKGSIEKIEFLNRHKENVYFQKFLFYALNPMMTFNISQKIAEKFYQIPINREAEIFESGNMAIFQLCDSLSCVKGLSNEDINYVHQLLWKYEDGAERNLYILLLSKALRLGVTATTVNKVIPNLIPVWEVQQAYSIDNNNNWHNQEFWLTQKLNGVRATYYNGKLYSRNGTPYTGLEHIIEILDNICNGPMKNKFVFDGELTLIDTEGFSDNAAFRKSTGIINSDAQDKTQIKYTIFDLVRESEFEGESVTPYSERRAAMDTLSHFITGPYVSILPVMYHGTDETQIDILLDKMIAEDKEGLMLNLDVPYQRKRHNGILKIKRFYTMDLPITNVEPGNGRLSNTTGNLVVDFKGNEVRVGSGLTDSLRTYFWNNKDKVIGKLCEVKYKEISTEKTTGKESLQFPVFIRMREDKHSVSYS